MESTVAVDLGKKNDWAVPKACIEGGLEAGRLVPDRRGYSEYKAVGCRAWQDRLRI